MKIQIIPRASLFSLMLGIAFCVTSTLSGAAEPSGAERDKASRLQDRPNIVFILVDDYSMNLIRWMRHSENGAEVSAYKSLVGDGATFSNYFVSNSLCCPSRSTIFTGKYSHNTGVFTNVSDLKNGVFDGGFQGFNHNKNQLHTFAIALKNAGYTTAMLGKYLNGYKASSALSFNKEKAWNQWGWDEWDVAGEDGYAEFSYKLNQNGNVVYYGIDEKDYLTDNISRIAQEFIKSAKRPFFVEIATYAPHDPYRPAYRDENAYSHARVPRTPPYAARPDKHAPDWMRDVPKLTPNDEDLMDADYRLRAQSVRAIDKMIYDVRATLASAGLDKDTYVFFTSDNGFHMGEYSFPPGKMAPFDTDIHVPLVIAGPNIKHQTITEIAQTVDLAPTFIDIGGGELPPTKPDGQSLLSLLQGKTPDKWRSMALVEHHGVPDDPNDPDNDSKEKWDGINPPDYLAIRSKKYLYVEFYNNTDCPTTTPHCEQTATEWAYYDLTTDPDELKNVYQTLSRAKKHNLKNKLADNKNCGQSGEKTCWLSQQ